MDISPVGLARNVLPQIPLVIKTAILSLLGRSPHASVQDLITETLVVAARPILGTPAGLLESQAQFSKDWAVWGRMWIAKYTIPPSGDQDLDRGGVLGVRQALMLAIGILGDGTKGFDRPQVEAVEAEWTGYRRGVSHIALRPDVPESEQYKNLMQEVEPDCPTILYFHGGAFCLMDPATHRWTTSALAKETHGRCYSVRYRLSPQNTFPAALLDALVAYLSLLSPPPHAFHAPVPASRIIIAGDSSGACLATSLLLLLLTLRRLPNVLTHLSFHGRDVPIPSPPAAGLAITSPWLDVSRALPSVHRNTKYDIIAPPPTDPSTTGATPNFPPDSIWPAKPPRVETYCAAHMVIHPLVSPLAARPESWQGAPPVYLNVGWESMQDEAEVFARRVHAAGATVIFDGFEGMPHCFAMVPWNKAGRMAFQHQAAFCRHAAAAVAAAGPSLASWTDKDGKTKIVRFEDLGMKREGEGHERDVPLDDEMVDSLLSNQRAWRVKLEQELREKWMERERVPKNPGK